MDVAAFLGRFPPFDALTPQRLAALAEGARLVRFPAGTDVVRQGGVPAPGLYVVRDGSVELLDAGRLLDLLGEGEVFGLSALTDAGPAATVRARQDTTCYLIDAAVAEELFGTEPGRSFVLGTFRERQRRRRDAAAAALADATGAIGRGRRPVRELLSGELVEADPTMTIAAAAALMTERRVSSLLVPGPEGSGIVTDEDLRARVLATGLDPATPVSVIAGPPVSVPASTTGDEALLRMFAEGVHSLVVIAEDGRVLGVVSDGDVMAPGGSTPIALRRRIEGAGSVAEVAEAGRELPSVVAALVDASADPVDVGRTVAFVIDAMTRRLIRLAMRELGEAPAPWAWLALGSAARREQALRTDQDHALAYDTAEEHVPDVDPYFARLAASVTDGLEAAGIARCAGDVMATHPALRRTVPGWSAAMHTWMEDLSPRGSELSSIVYDYRQVDGPLDVVPTLDAVVGDARTRPGFLRALGRRALELHPPTGFVRDLVVERHGEHAGRLDVKGGGITIVGNLARVHAVASGATAKGTVERLRATVEGGPLSPTAAAELVEAFGFLWEIRLRHQVDRVRAGAAPDDFVDPSTLGPVARRGLREAFRVIARAQRELAMAMDLRTG